MKTTVNRKALLKALQTVKPAVPTKSCLPVLQSVLLEVADGELSITGTDLDVAINVKLEVVMQTYPGAVTVNMKDLISFVKSSTSDITALHADNGRLQVNSMSLLAGDIEEYPDVKFKLDGLKAQSVLTSQVIDAMYTASKYITDDKIRIVLTGVLMEISPGCTIITGTDGCALTNIKLDALDNIAGEYNIILPVFPIAQLHKHIKQKWNMKLFDDRAIFTDGNVTIVSKLIEGPYPNYKQVIPEDMMNDITIDRKALLNAVSMLLPCTNVLTHNIKFIFFGDELVLTVENMDTGLSGHETISINYQETSQTIGFSGQYVKLILESINTDKVLWKTNTPSDASMIYPGGLDNERYLLVPLRIDQ